MDVSLSQLAPRVHQFDKCHSTHRAAAVWYRYMGNLRPAHSTHGDGDPGIVNGLTANDRWHRIYRSQ